MTTLFMKRKVKVLATIMLKKKTFPKRKEKKQVEIKEHKDNCEKKEV